MLGAGAGDLVQSGIIALLVTAVIGLRWKDLLLHAFDPVQAQALGLPVRMLHYGLLCLLSLAVVGALTATGIILTIAMLIAPGAIAFLLTRRFPVMLALAAAVAVAASLLGVYLSFFLDSAPAPTIVLLLTFASAAQGMMSPGCEGLTRARKRQAFESRACCSPHARRADNRRPNPSAKDCFRPSRKFSDPDTSGAGIPVQKPCIASLLWRRRLDRRRLPARKLQGLERVRRLHGRYKEGLRKLVRHKPVEKPD
jgi:hypothetical protein